MKRLFIISAAAALSSLLFAGNISASEKRTVAVMNFANYGSNDLKQLSGSLPDTVSSAMSLTNKVTVVERRQLGKVVDEIALGQTGLINTGKVAQAGRLSQADILVVGSVSGSNREVIVTIKAVEVETGKILDARSFKGPFSSISELASMSAGVMASVVSGAAIGTLSVSSKPAGAAVYADGAEIGRTPIVEHSLTEGKHRIKVVKQGFIDYETTLSITPGKDKQINPYLIDENAADRFEFDASVYYFVPFNSDFEQSILYSIFWGYTFDVFLIGFEGGASIFPHDQEVENFPFDDNLMARDYMLISLMGHLSMPVIPRSWAISRYIQPFAGIMMGYNMLQDRSDNYDNTSSHLFAYGIKAGVNLFPYSAFSLFAECRITSVYPRLKRTVYEGQGFTGGLITREEKVAFTALSLGGGIRIYF